MRHSRIARVLLTLALPTAASLVLLSAADRVEAGPAAPAKAPATPDARGIMQKVTVTRKLAGSEARVKMSNFTGGKAPEVKAITMATKLYDGGRTEKRVYRFTEPAEIKGTGVLVFDYENKADDVWIYLPVMHKTRRIATSERSKAFMGSEFSYGDLNIPKLDDYDYQLVKEEPAGGEPCYVIDVTAKTEDLKKEEGYQKKTYWISKKTFVFRKILFVGMDGKPLKELTASNVQLLDPKHNRYRALRMEVVNKRNGRRSVFDTEKVSFAPDTKDEYFTTAYLERPL
ncbi:MAG: outer membrane lipoprotein-sorting protein [Polyangiaceae bacterium]|nr:outer membrane lipoprotein-sorting protein [Polyangiaceae bacterium]